MKYFFCFCIVILNSFFVIAQKKVIVEKDSIVTITPTNFSKYIDTAALRKYNPNIAIKRSAMLPGWGQYTNKKIWKIPIVYAGIGIPAYLFFRNNKQYKESRAAYNNATDGNPANDYLIKSPYNQVINNPERIRVFSRQVRQNQDYSVLFFILFWGLNVADAAVDANLKTFDVNDNLSLKIKAGYSELANTKGLSLVLNIGKRK
ncbi:MAG: DUF5683 domain-containing protein [Ferruginibacter sp.]|nr:hypothetical protein [Ferruginibacter sp.]